MRAKFSKFVAVASVIALCLSAMLCFQMGAAADYNWVVFDDDVYVFAVAGQRFVHGVVDDLVNKVMKSPAAGGSYVHSGTFSYGFQAL